MITVFTPSYNRKNELKKLYDSLLKQDNKDFEWVAQYLIREIKGTIAA